MLPPRERELLKQGLPDELVSELVAGVSSGGSPFGLDQMQPGSFFDGSEEGGRVVEHRAEERVREPPSDDRREGQRFPRLFFQTLEAAPDDQTHALGNAEILERQAVEPFAVAVEEAPFFGQMLVDLFDEEGVALGFRVDGSDEALGRLAPAERLDHFPDPIGREAREVDPLDEPLSHELSQRRGQGWRQIELEITVGADDDDGHAGHPGDQVAKKVQRRLVRPVEVLEDQQQRPFGAEALDEAAEAVEEIVPFSLRRHLERGREVRIQAAQAGIELRDLRRFRTEGVTQALPLEGARRGFDDLDPGAEGSRSFALVAVPRQDEETELGGLLGCTGGQPRLADAGFAAQGEEGAAAGRRGLQGASELCDLARASDEGCAVAPERPRTRRRPRSRGRRRDLPLESLDRVAQLAHRCESTLGVLLQAGLDHVSEACWQAWDQFC